MSEQTTGAGTPAAGAATFGGPAGESRLLEMTRQAVIVTDLEGRIGFWNLAAEALYGWRAHEVVGRRITEVTPSADSAAHAEEIMATLAAGASWSGVFEVTRRDGSTFRAQVIDSPIYDEKGRLAGVVGLSTDVTEHEAELARFRRGDDEMSDFFDNASVGLHWVGADGRVLRVNRTELELLGYAEDEYVGRNIADFHADADTIDDILERLKRGETLVDYPARLRCKDGSIRHVLISSNVLFRDGRFVHTRCFTRDVTERRRDEERMRELKEAAEAASRAKSDFLAVMSHELRTPLNAILGYGSLVADEVVGPLTSTQKHHLERMLESGRYLLEMVEQVLRLSRVDAGRERVVPEPVDVRLLVEELAARVRPQAAAKGVELAASAAGAGQLVTDPAKLRVILLNLLENAVKFTPAGHIRFTAEAADSAVVFRVEDTGPGIPREHRDSVFEPFGQVDQSHTRPAGGAGLGLSVARRLARLLGGDVTLDSEPGRGSTFTVTVPLRPSDASVGVEASADCASAVGRDVSSARAEAVESDGTAGMSVDGDASNAAVTASGGARV